MSPGGRDDQVDEWRARQRGGSVVFHGWRPHADVLASMQRMDVLVAPYQATSMGVGGAVDISAYMSPLKIFEYMASGRPLVTSDLPVLREVLVDGETALLRDPADIDGWADAIRLLLADDRLAGDLTTNALDTLRASYTWDRRAESILRLAQEIYVCGLAGLVGPVAASDALDRMLDSIEHRGPDGRGRLDVDGLSIGMVRLAVIDVDHGHQPKTSDCGRWTIFLNGEIYNHRELRQELESAGRRFRSRSDTEVVANALAEWGRAALLRFDGMFAIAGWDSHRERMTLAGDRFGEKPLYLRRHPGGGMTYASEAKALAAHEPLGAR